MSRLRTASLCLTDIVEAAKAGHSAFSRSEKNGKVYFNVAIWDKEEPDQYDKNVSIQLNPHKDHKERDGNPFVGNGKIHEYQPAVKQNSPADPIFTPMDNDDLPF